MRLMNLSAIQRQSLIHLCCTIAVTIAGFVCTMICTHILGKDIMGVYFLFLTYVSIFNLIGDSGFGASTIKRISEGTNQNELFSAFVVLRTILLVVSTVILLSIPNLLPHIEELSLFIIIALVCAYVSNIVVVGLSGKNYIGVVSLSNGLGEFTRIIISIVLVILGWSLMGLIGAYVVGTILVAVYCIILKRLDYKLVKFHKEQVKSLAVFGLWIFLINTAGLIMGYADTIFIGSFMEVGDVAIYRVALSLSTGALFIANAILSTLAPKISNWSVTNQENVISSVISRSITYSLVIAIPMFVGGLFLLEKILYYFYGADFAVGSTVCCVLLFQQIVNIFLMFLGCALSNSGFARQSFYGAFCAVTVNIILDIVLIPKIGIMGAAIASLLAITLNLIIVYIQLNKRIKIHIEYKPLIHIIVASALMGIMVYILRPETFFALIITIVIGACAYFGVLAVLDKPLRTESLDAIKKLIGK